MTDLAKIHPLRRRKHRRGRRKKKEPVVELALAPIEPAVVMALRNRLSLLSQQKKTLANPIGGM